MANYIMREGLPLRIILEVGSSLLTQVYYTYDNSLKSSQTECSLIK